MISFSVNLHSCSGYNQLPIVVVYYVKVVSTIDFDMSMSMVSPLLTMFIYRIFFTLNSSSDCLMDFNHLLSSSCTKLYYCYTPIYWSEGFINHCLKIISAVFFWLLHFILVLVVIQKVANFLDCSMFIPFIYCIYSCYIMYKM